MSIFEKPLDDAISEIVTAVEKVQPAPITGGEYFRFLHPDMPDEFDSDREAEDEL